LKVRIAHPPIRKAVVETKPTAVSTISPRTYC
jgi:hypothetical protein